MRPAKALLSAFLGVLVLSSPFSLPGAELLPNGDFSKGLDGWSWEQWKGLAVPGALETAEKFRGKPFFKMALPGDTGGRFFKSPAIPADPSSDCVLKISFRCKDLPQNAVKVRVLQSGRPELGSPEPPPSYGWVAVPGSSSGELLSIGGSFDWKEFQVAIPGSSLAFEAKDLFIYVQHGMVGVGELDIAAVSFETVAPAKGSPQPPRPKERKPSPKATSNKNEVERDLEMKGVNLLSGDSSFETGSDCWLGGRSVRGDAVDGEYALELDASSAKFFHGRMYYGIIKKDVKYVLSFYAKAKAPGMKADIVLNNLAYQVIAKKSFALPLSWERFSVEIPAQKSAQDLYLDLISSGSPGVMLLDAFQLEAGEAPSEYKRPSGVLVGLGNTLAPGNLLLEDEAVPVLEAGVVNNGSEAVSGVLSFATVDYSGATVLSKDVPLSLEPGKPQRLPMQALPKMARGYFVSSLKFIAKDGKALAKTETPFGVVPKPLPFDSTTSKFFGMHPHGERLSLDVLPRLGVRSVRVFMTWSAGESQKGKLSIPDSYYSKFDKYSLEIMECLKTSFPPKWAVREDGLLKDVKDYAEFCEMIAARMKGRVSHWEIDNEPDLNFVRKFNLPIKEAAEYYGEVVAAAGPAVKRGNPDAQVLAMSGSGSDALFSEHAMAKCAGSFDVMTVHPYTGTRYIGPKSTHIPPESYLRKRLLEYVDQIKANGKGQRLWVDELGWGIDNREPYESDYVRKFSDFVARTIIICRSVPEVERLIWFKAQGCYENQFYQYGLWRSEFEPLPAALFYANLAIALRDVKPLRPLFEGDLQAYSFENQDKTALVALWKRQGNFSEISLELPEGSASLRDLFGNEIQQTRKDGKLVVPVSASPLLLTVKGMSPELACKAVEAASVNIEPVSISLFFSDSSRVSGFVKNNFPRDIEAVIRAKGEIAGVEPKELKLSLPANGTKSFSFAIPPQPGSAPRSFMLECSTPLGSVSKAASLDLAYCYKAQAGVDALKGPGAMKLAERKYIYPPDPGIAWESPEDLSCVFNCSWDSQFFHFAADVTEKVFLQNADNYQAWHGDSIQLAFDVLNDAPENSFKFDEDDVEFIAWLSPKAGPRLAKTFSGDGAGVGVDVEGSKVSVTRAGTVTSYRISIPWSALGKLQPVQGRVFGFNFIVNNNDGAGRNYWLGLTPGIGEVKYPYCYKKFSLAEPGK